MPTGIWLRKRLTLGSFGRKIENYVSGNSGADGESGTDTAGSTAAPSDLMAGREMPGDFVQFNVGGVEEAVALACRFKAGGRYRYFRGQRDATWPVTSSFARQNPADRVRARDEIGAFAGWVSGAGRLVPYLTTDDKIIAAAQHHQITHTTFIDFSTDPVVAGWFATDGGVKGEEGAIYLVDPDEIGGIFEAISRSGPVLRFITPDVPNLWRLQAQSGVFLEAQCNIAHIWPLDRIVFPQTGAMPQVDRRRIYPDRRSHLEQMIEDYKRQRTQGERPSQPDRNHRSAPFPNRASPR